MVVLFGRNGSHKLELLIGEFASPPTTTLLKQLHKARHRNRAAPVIVAGIHGNRVWLCVPGTATEDASSDSLVLDAMDESQAARLAEALLDEVSEHAALRRLASVLPNLNSEIPGLSNQGMMATHELRVGVPIRGDWKQQCDRSIPILRLRDRELITALGFAVDVLSDGNTSVLRAGDQKRAIAIFLSEEETFDQGAKRFDGASPVRAALAAADRENLPWVVLARGEQLRVYAAKADTGVGRRGRAQTYVGVDLSLLPAETAGYLTLLFSAEALLEGGTFEEVLHESGLYATSVGERLRDRVYVDVVPSLAQAIADRFKGTPSEQELADLYEQTLVILFRLLFVAYAEDKGLLPLSTAAYEPHSLKHLSRELADRLAAADGTVEFAETTTDLWDRVTALWAAVAVGNSEWGVPAYAGGLFDATAGAGAAIKKIRLSNAEFGSAVMALLVDATTSDGIPGPVDFRSLSVREFGTIYEGLLESSLSVAPSDLALDKKGSYIPASADSTVVVPEGRIYFHNRSGARKATGSYFTKPFAVEHLLDQALMPALDAHLARVRGLIESGREADAADALFDFRCVDLSMGSGHFLVAAVDRIEARITSFLAEVPIPHVQNELVDLRQAARAHLGPLADSVEIDDINLVRRLVARRCIYGIDVNPIAVELARLAVWLHTFVPGLPLSFLNHGLICGDSLTGIGTIDEAVDAIAPPINTRNSGGLQALLREPVVQILERARPSLERLARVTEMSTGDLAESASAQAAAFAAVEPARILFDLVVAARAGQVDMPEGPDEDRVMSHKGVALAADFVSNIGAVHFPIAFPEVFIRECPGFDCILGNPPWEEATIEELSFWARFYPGLKALSEHYKSKEIERLRDARPDLCEAFQLEKDRLAQVRRLLLSGPFKGMGTGDPDLYKAFAWRFLQLVRREGFVGVVLPRSIWSTKGNTAWRLEALRESSIQILVGFNEREWMFTDVNPGYAIALVAIHRGHAPVTLIVWGPVRSRSEYKKAILSPGAQVDLRVVGANDPEMVIPQVGSENELELFQQLIVFPGLGAKHRTDFLVRPHAELHATKARTDLKLFHATGSPVFNHLHIGHLTFDGNPDPFAWCDLQEVQSYLLRFRKRTWRRADSAFGIRSAEWNQDDATHPIFHCRIAFRDVVHASNTRKVWFALVPPASPLTNTAPYLVFDRDDELVFAWVLGVMGSSVVDWVGHLRIGLHLNYFILNALPCPSFDAGSDLHLHICSLAACLSMEGIEDHASANWVAMATASVRREATECLVAELDAAVSLIFGMKDADLPIVWNEDSPMRPSLEMVRDLRAELIERFGACGTMEALGA